MRKALWLVITLTMAACAGEREVDFEEGRWIADHDPGPADGYAEEGSAEEGGVGAPAPGDEEPEAEGDEPEAEGDEPEAEGDEPEAEEPPDEGGEPEIPEEDEPGGGDEPAPIPPPAPDECITDVSPGERTFSCEGLSFALSVPEECVTTACGLILDIHGMSMTAGVQNNNTHLRQLGRESGFIVIQPTAPGLPPLTSWSASRDDDRVLAIVLRVVDVFHVDEDRIHVTGFSQGGWMTWRFVCDHSDVFASAAPAAAATGCFPLNLVPGCRFRRGDMPAEEIDILFMAGLNDTNMVRPGCSESQRDMVVEGLAMSSEELVEEGDGYTRTRYSNAQGTVFELLWHEYTSSATSPSALIPAPAGHCFPGSDDPGDGPNQLYSFACDGPCAFHWGEEVIEFFLAHPKRR